MNKKKVILIILLSLVSLFFIYFTYNYIRIINAKIIVVKVPNKELEVYSEVHISELIKSINGTLLEDNLVDTSIIGEHLEEFSFINDDNIKVNYSIEVKVVDTTKPLIGVPSSYKVNTGYNSNLAQEFFCGDNYDDEPLCMIEGEYDTSTSGEYELTYIAQDSSKNISKQKFTLKVVEPSSTKLPSTNNQIITTNYSDIIKDYKKDNTSIGIDISKWQGNIDFKKIKEQGVEFVIIRVGSENKDGEFYLDPKFTEYIEECNKEKIKVGIYYYSYATSTKKAIKEAKWVVKQIKKYKIDLPIAFDWENWSNYREYNLSFHSISEVANAFMNEIEDNGYKAMLYSSKYYLENIWTNINNKVWLAHYTKQTNYQGNYYLWQLCANGQIDGIDNLVDIDIMYK